LAFQFIAIRNSWIPGKSTGKKFPISISGSGKDFTTLINKQGIWKVFWKFIYKQGLNNINRDFLLPYFPMTSLEK
jgi:hypothetical protein